MFVTKHVCFDGWSVCRASYIIHPYRINLDSLASGTSHEPFAQAEWNSFSTRQLCAVPGRKTSTRSEDGALVYTGNQRKTRVLIVYDTPTTFAGHNKKTRQPVCIFTFYFPHTSPPRDRTRRPESGRSIHPSIHPIYYSRYLPSWGKQILTFQLIRAEKEMERAR